MTGRRVGGGAFRRVGGSAGASRAHGKADGPLRFHILKGSGYHGCVSVEASGFNDLPGTGREVLNFLREQWAQA